MNEDHTAIALYYLSQKRYSECDDYAKALEEYMKDNYIDSEGGSKEIEGDIWQGICEEESFEEFINKFKKKEVKKKSVKN